MPTYSTQPASLAARVLHCVSTLRSVRICDLQHLQRKQAVGSVAIVGSTCTGKSTIAAAIRASHLLRRGTVCVPLRYITRPRRKGETPLENQHVTPMEFDRLVASGSIGLAWTRIMEGGRQERYGFETVRTESLPVYSANNALCNNPSSIWPIGALSDTLLIGIHAPDDIRRQRLRARSPDLMSYRPAEAQHRLEESSAALLPYVDLVVENHGALESRAPQEVVHLIEGLLS